MLEAEPTNEPTILDYLNEDCWRAVLKYVPIQDLIRTEGTSRNWQARVLEYLQGVTLSISDDRDRLKTSSLKLREQDYESFALWTNKLGPSVVATCCYSLETMKTVRDNCPNLESLTIVDMLITPGPEMFKYNLNKNFKCLKGLHFYNCRVSDDGIKQFIADKALEELEVNRCQMSKGNFLKTINLTNLKSLTLHLQLSDGFYFESFLTAVKYLGELKKLVLTVVNKIYPLFEVETEIQYVLDEMPKLEYLEINNDSFIEMRCRDYGPLSRLTRLQYLQVALRVPSKGVEVILRECKELRSLGFSDCSAMSGRSVVNSLCRWGKQLRSLYLENFEELMDFEVVNIISGCPELMSLKLPGARILSPDLPAYASEARHAVRPGVRLRLEIDLDMSDEAQLRGKCNYYEDLELKINIRDDTDNYWY